MVIRTLVAALAVMLAGAAAAAPKFLDCAASAEPDLCRQSQAQLRAEAPAARRDHGAMRNVAFCLWTGCDGAVARDREQSCAIRRAIMSKHKRKADRSDEGHFATCVQAGY